MFYILNLCDWGEEFKIDFEFKWIPIFQKL